MVKSRKRISRRKALQAVSAGALGMANVGVVKSRPAEDVKTRRTGSCDVLKDVVPAEKDWALSRRDESNTAFNPEHQIASQKPSLDWKFTTRNEGMNTPIVARNRVFASGDYPNGDLYSLTEETGVEQWTDRSSGILEVPPTGQSNVVTSRAGLPTNQMESHDRKTGQVEKYNVPVGYTHDLLATPRAILLAHNPPRGDQPEITVVETQSESVCGRFEPPISSSKITDVAVTDGTIYASAVESGDNHPRDGVVFAVDAREGSAEWDVVTDYPVEGIAVSNGYVYTVTANQVLAVEASTGDVSWTTERGGGPTMPAVTENTVFVGGRFNLTAIDVETGQTRWKTDVQGHSIRPSVGGETVYTVADALPGRPAKLLAIDRTTGEQVWKETFGQVDVTAPALSEAAVFVATSTGTVYKYA